MLISAVIAAMVIGFLAGMLTLRKSQQWCPRCGSTMRCPEPHDTPGVRRL